MEILENHLDQAKVYTSLILNANAIDRAERTIKNVTMQLNEDNTKLESILQEIRDVWTDPEKLKMLARIKGVQLGRRRVADLTEKEMEFRDMLDEGIVLSKRVEMLNNDMEKAKSNLNMARKEMEANRASLNME